MALSAVLFATMNFLARMATASAPWTEVGAVRAGIGAVVAFSVARMRRQSIRPNDLKAVFWRSFFGTISMLTTFYALSSHTLSLGDTSTLLNLSPVFLAVLAPIFLREKTTGGVAIAIGLALFGVVLVVRPSFIFGGEPAILGALGPSPTVTALTATGAALSTAIAMMMLRRVGQTETAETIAFSFSIFATIVFAVISLFTLKVPTPRDFVCMVFAGVCAGFGQLAMTRAYTLESAARVSGLSYLNVVASTILGIVFLGEVPKQTAAIGMLLVIVGGVLVTRRSRVTSRP